MNVNGPRSLITRDKCSLSISFEFKLGGSGGVIPQLFGCHGVGFRCTVCVQKVCLSAFLKVATKERPHTMRILNGEKIPLQLVFETFYHVSLWDFQGLQTAAVVSQPIATLNVCPQIAI